jgi:hypothetical protein
MKTVFDGRRLPMLAAALMLAGGCGGNKPAERELIVPIGSTIEVGPLKYTVFQTEWKDTLDGDHGPRMPKHKFLLVQLAVENSTNEDAAIPMMTLLDDKGQTYAEESDGQGVSSWLGYLRTAKPGETARGFALFDAPQTSFKMRVSSGGDPEHERTALVELPLRIDLGTSPGGVGGS